jgi:hypothetical protein
VLSAVEIDAGSTLGQGQFGIVVLGRLGAENVAVKRLKLSELRETWAKNGTAVAQVEEYAQKEVGGGFMLLFDRLFRYRLTIF